MSASAKTVVDSLREVVQDLLVPELRAVRVSVDALRTEMLLRTDALQKELQLRDEMLRTEMQAGTAAVRSEMQAMSQKLDFAIDIRERLAALEARVPRQ